MKVTTQMYNLYKAFGLEPHDSPNKALALSKTVYEKKGERQ